MFRNKKLVVPFNFLHNKRMKNKEYKSALECTHRMIIIDALKTHIDKQIADLQIQWRELSEERDDVWRQHYLLRHPEEAERYKKYGERGCFAA